MKSQFQGLFPALLTPFSKNGETVLYDRACALADRLAKQGVAGLFPAGTTGEGMLMTLDERKTLLEEIVKAVGKKVKVIAHTGCLDTASTIELTRHAMKIGAAAAGIVTPGFYGYDEDALFRHYKLVAGAVKGFPVFLYNIPGCAKNALSPQFVLRVAHSIDNVIGLKDSAGVIQNLSLVIDGAPKGFTVLNGVDEYTYQAMLTGANGSVTSTANVVPELFLKVHRAVWAGDLKTARAAQTKLDTACSLFQYGKMVAYYKEGLRLRGFDAGCVRPPQRELTAAEKKAVAKALEIAGLI